MRRRIAALAVGLTALAAPAYAQDPVNIEDVLNEVPDVPEDGLPPDVPDDPDVLQPGEVLPPEDMPDADEPEPLPPPVIEQAPAAAVSPQPTPTPLPSPSPTPEAIVAPTSTPTPTASPTPTPEPLPVTPAPEALASEGQSPLPDPAAPEKRRAVARGRREAENRSPTLKLVVTPQQPTPTQPGAPAVPVKVAPNAPIGDRYVVRAGDTLSSIAARFGTTWRALHALNRELIADPDLIYPGQRLRIR